MATGSHNREFSTEELDAMAAAELPVENPETSRTASAPVASAPTAPEATGSPELAVGDGTSFSIPEPPRGPAMGPVAKLEAGREYSTEELDLIEQANKPKEFTSDELDKATVDALNDPKYIPTRDEFFEQKATKERMVAAGKLPGTAEVAAKAVGGLFVSAGDAFNMAVAHPLETIARSPATLQTGVGRAAISALQLGGWAKQALEGDPKYRDEATGEFFAFSDPDFLRQQMEQGKKLRPTNEEDLKDWEFQNHIYKKGIDSEYQDLGQKAGPTELITRVLTGRNQNELPIESQSQVVEMAADPTNLIPFGAGAKALGLSRGMKLVSSQAAGVVEKLSGGLVKGNDVLAERFAKVVTNTTGLAPEDLTTIGKALNYSKNVGIGAGIAGGAAAVGAPPEVAQFIAGFYPAYKAGLGVLRKIETGSGTAKIIMREAADATNGLDQAARAAVLANNSVPQVFKEVLERPSQFVSIESTPARLAANQSLSPQMRAFMGKLSNPAIVQAVRGSSALAKGAVKGVAINAPFAALAYNAGEDEQAAGMLGAGVAFGAAGAGIDRFTGLQERRQQAAISDVSRMLVDVELNAGDVSKLMSTQTPDNLVKLAAMQGTFRNGLDFVPLNAIDYEKNVSSNGGAGAAGLFLQATPGERARIYINLDAKRQGIEPHEFGHALLASGALDGQQKYAARAWVEKAYGADGIKARAAEYASAIIRAKNSEAFPDGNFEISPGTLASEMDNLTQGGLARGDMDGLDWARDEIFAETFAQASQSMDFSAIRRGAPAGGNVLTFAESILGAQSRALSASGVRIDPQTGAPLDTPDALFKENPLLATDKNLINQLGTYINNYRQWANDPTHEKPRPNKVAPSGRASDVINNPQVTFYDRGDGVKATTFAVQDPVTGQAVLRDQRDLNAEHAKVKDQLKALGGSKLLQPSDPVLGPKKTTDGRVTVRGRVLPQSFDFLNGFMPHIRNFARQFEALGAAGESMQVRYHAIGSGDTGAFQIKKLGNLEAITREVVPWGWELTKAGNLNATVLDLSQFRNRAMRAINEHNPALAVFEWDMGKIEGDLKQWMQNHRDELPGNTKIGDLKRDVLNSLVGVATTENRSRNPLHGSFGPGSAIKQFRLDRVDAAVGTGRQGFHFDYEKAKGNFMPDKPAPMPDLSRDLPTDKGQAVPKNTPTTGKPFEFFSIRNKEKSPFLGSRFGQDIEPHGKYMAESTPRASENLDARFEKGAVRFENPLVVDFGGGYGDSSNWKNVLSSQYEGKTGLELSQAIRDAGHDGIITMEPSKGPNRPAHTSEIVDIRNLHPPGQAMPDVTITPDEAKRQGLVGPVYHGSPDFKGQKFDLKYRARNTGLSRGGFSFTDNVESAKGYASNKIDSAQSAVDSANDVMGELAGRMDNGLKVDGFADSTELPEFNSNYVDDIENLGIYFDEIANKIPKDLGDRLRAAASKTNEPANPVVVEAFLKNPKVTEINGKKLWVTENPDDIFVSGVTKPPQGQAMPDAAGPKGKDVFARSLEDIKLSIPANERWIGTKLPGQPVRAADGRRFLEHDLDTKTGSMNVTQPSLDKAWADAIAVTGPAASRALAELQEKGFTMKPPPESHWKAAENLPNKDRLWYEISAEAMTESFPDFSRDELGKTMDVVAATSPLADPNYNGRLAIAILAEDFQKTPSVTPAVVQTSVKDALMGEFGKAEQRKVGSFGGTFRFLEGMSDDPPLTTNDRQVAASMGIPDSAFGTYPVLYELQSRFVNNLRDHINANGGMNSQFGPFQSHQLQALSWVQQRAEQRLQRRTNITEEEAFNGDAYASAFKLAADDLREAGINVPQDPTTGLPRFTASVLSDPRVQQTLTPPGTEFLKSTIQTMEMNTKLREDGKKFADALEESKKLAIPGNIKLAEQVLQRAAKSLTLRTADKVDKSIKLPSPLSKLASVFGAANADITRIEFGRGTFQGDVSPNVRIPMDAVPEKYRPAFMSVLGKHFYQAAQAASRFKSVDSAQAQSHSIWMHGKSTMDGLENLAQALTEEGHEANISQRPNGVLIDVHPKFTDQGPVPINYDSLQELANLVLGEGNSSVIPREYHSIYLEKQDYDSTILKATKELLNEHANKIAEATSISLGAAKNYLRGDKALDKSTVPLNRRAEKIRDSYRQRIDQLQSSQKELKSLFKDFEADTREATGEMQKRIDAYHKKASKPSNPSKPTGNNPSAEDLAAFK